MKRTKFPNREAKPKIEPAPWKLNTNGLDPKEILFVHEYLVDQDPARAAVAAKLASDNAPAKGKKKVGQKVLQNPDVIGYLNQAIEQRVSRTKITEDKVLHELAKVAFYDPIDMFYDNGGLKNINDMPKSVRQAISDIEYRTVWAGRGDNRVRTGYVTKIKLQDKQTALRTILSHINKIPIENNYNQYNIQNNYNVQNNNMNVSLSDFSKEELDVLKKMIGDEDPQEIIDLQCIEEQYAS